MSAVIKSTVVAIGVFDGVHSGHRYLIGKAKDYANSIGGLLTVASFNPHPVSVLRPDTFLGLLTELNYRTTLLKEAGADIVEYINFDNSIALMSPDEFIDEVILGQLNADAVVVGQNFRFGVKASGNVETLKTLSNKFEFNLEVVQLVGDKQIWSSTRIRNLILTGEVKQARLLLNRPHRLTGIVIHGDHRGREIGYPTANLELSDNFVIPADGIYSGLLNVGDDVYPAAISIGTNPTFKDVLNRRIEAYVLDQTDLNLYGKTVDLDFINFLRPMAQFEQIEELLEAMGRDIEQSRLEINDFLNSANH